jgi:hypothetical protein
MDYIKDIKKIINDIKTDRGFISYLNETKFDWYEREISIIQDKIIKYAKDAMKKICEYALIVDFPILKTSILKNIINRNGVRYILFLIADNKVISKDEIFIHFAKKMIDNLDNVFVFALIKTKSKIDKEKIKNLKAGYNIGNFFKHIESVALKNIIKKLLKKKKLYIDDIKINTKKYNY